MEKYLISVIIPIYNAEKYVKKCLESVIKQTYKNIEIIIVDDGSTDNSINICKECEDLRIKIIKKDKNEGLSVARNIGIENAAGKYITFIDSDDYIENDYIEHLYNLIEKYNTKMSICSYYIKTKRGKILHNATKETKKILSTKEALERMLLDRGFSISTWGKMYERNLFSDIQFPQGKLYEDNSVTYKLIKKCDKISYSNLEKYCYCKRDDSITNSKFTWNELDKIEQTNKMCNEINNWYPELNNILIRRNIYAEFSVLRKMVFAKDIDIKIKKKYRRKLLGKWKYFFTNSKIQARDRIAFISLLFGLKFFKISWVIYCKIKY